MSADNSREVQQRTIREMLDSYAAGVREFRDQKLLAVHQAKLRLRAAELIEITWAELAAAVSSAIEDWPLFERLTWAKAGRRQHPNGLPPNPTAASMAG